jgi:hypothetical protein
MLVEAVVQSAETNGIVLYGLALREGTVGPEWVTSPLDLDEAGPGTRWARVGGRAYVAKPGGTIRYVDLTSRLLISAEVLNATLEAYEGTCVPSTDHPVTPVLFGFGDVLIVEYTPAAVRPRYDAAGQFVGQDWIPTTCILAVRGDSVLGQIVCHEGHLTVMREGRLTQELDLDPSRQPFWWFAGSGTGP